MTQPTSGKQLMQVRLSPARTALLYAAFAALWIVSSGYLLTITVNDPQIQSRIELAKGLAFVAVTSGLLYLLLKRKSDYIGDRPTTAQTELVSLPTSFRLVLIFAALALLVPLIDITFYKVRVPQRMHDTYENLNVIADFKSNQIENWLNERRGDAQELASNQEFVQQIGHFLLYQKHDAGLPKQILNELDTLLANHAFDSILLSDTSGRLLFSIGKDVDIPRTLRNLLDQSLSSRQVQFSDLYRDDAGNINMDWVVPIIASDQHGKRAVGAVVLRAMPERFLYPLIQSWPLHSNSGEISLVKREGETILYLNPLRFRKEAALTLHDRLNNPDLPAAIAIRNDKPGTMAGFDYRQVPVLAAYRPVTGTSWYLVAKLDRDEVMKPVRVQLNWISGISSAAVVLIMAMLLMFLRQQQRTHQLALRTRSMEAILENERRFRAVAQSAHDAIITVDSNGNVVDWNPGAENMFGYAEAEIKGESLVMLMPERFVEQYRADIARVVACGETRVISNTVELAGRHKDGGEFPLELSLAQWETGGDQYFTAIIRDITERKAAELKVHHLTQLYAALSQCNQAIVRSTSEQELFEQICRGVVQFGGMKMAWIGLVDESDKRVKPVASYGAGEEYLESIQISVDADDLLGRGPTGTAIRDNRPFWCQDFQNDPATTPWQEISKNFGWKASAALPLNRSGIPVGSVTLYSDTVDAFGEEVRKLLTEMATDISFALGNFAHEAERRRIWKELEFKTTILQTQQETSLDAILVVDENGEIISCNHQFVDLWRLPPHLVSAHVDEPVLQSVAAQIENPEAFLARIRYLYESRVEKSHEEIQLKDGRVIDRYSAPITGADGQYYGRVWYFRDITERKRALQELGDSEQRFRGLVEQSLAGIYIIQGGKLVYVNPRCAEILGQGSADELIGHDPLQFIAEGDRARIAEEMRRLLDKEAPSILSEFDAIHTSGTYIRVGAHASFAIYQGQPSIIGLAQDISEKKRAEEQKSGFVTQLKSAFLDTVKLAMSLGEMRDPYTAGHERRVAGIAVAIATALGLDEQRVEGIMIAGYLHDIGKISIPAEILAKPGRLTATEYSLVQGHAKSSYEVLKQVDFPWPVATVALQHHERIDGSGYPNGLKSDEVLLESRIMAVADVVEAMASHRPYRPGLGIDKALAEIERGRGISYDPVVADACLRLFREQGYVLPV